MVNAVTENVDLSEGEKMRNEERDHKKGRERE